MTANERTVLRGLLYYTKLYRDQHVCSERDYAGCQACDLFELARKMADKDPDPPKSLTEEERIRLLAAEELLRFSDHQITAEYGELVSIGKVLEDLRNYRDKYVHADRMLRERHTESELK